jgi:hypothetical protein
MYSPLTSQTAKNPPLPGHRLAAGLEIGGVMTASRLERPAALTVSCGIAELDTLTGGLPRGALTEICGLPSSGRSSLMLAALAEATWRQEICALVDATDSFDPSSAAAAGVDLERLLWIRISRSFQLQASSCKPDAGRFAAHNLKTAGLRALAQTLKVTDLLLQSSGFGMVAIDLAGMPPEWTRRIPLASWFRFRRAVEHTSTVLLVIAQEPYAKTCASLVLNTAAVAPVLCQTTPEATHAPPHSRLLRGLDVQVEGKSRFQSFKVSGFQSFRV